MPKALDITNKVFGNLKAISKAPSRAGKTYWLCECLLCGNKKEIQTSHLTSGASKSCGCTKVNNFDTDNLFVGMEKKCVLCGSTFTVNTHTRQYCFNCSPKGVNSSEALKIKKRKLKQLLVKYKGGKCEQCGYDKCIGALHFHHRNPQEKDFNISQINLSDNNFSMDVVISEIDKCDLLCANCHAERHFGE